MTLQLLRRQFTVDEYHKMIGAGILGEDDRVELLDGEIHNMSPIDPVHAAYVNRLNHLLSRQVDESVIVSVQNPVLLDDYSEPEPDVALLRWRADYYAQAHPAPSDVLLLLEVANSSAGYDRSEKLPRYAAAGINEVWIINIKRRAIEQYMQPDGDEYSSRKILRRGTIALTLPELTLTLSTDAIFGVPT